MLCKLLEEMASQDTPDGHLLGVLGKQVSNWSKAENWCVYNFRKGFDLSFRLHFRPQPSLLPACEDLELALTQGLPGLCGAVLL